ncbi:MAG: Rab family GTPase [Candidatus Thorarchaeota archaeon]
MRFINRRKRKGSIQNDLSYVKNKPSFKQEIKEKETFKPHFLFKILLVGYNESGKIHYLEKFGNSWFESNTKLTIGISFEVKKIKIKDVNIKLQIWDLATEQRWKDLIPYYCRGALGAILMFETANSETLYKLSHWIPIIREYTSNIPIILMGNNDDVDNSRQVSAEEGIEFVKSEQLNGYFEASVTSGENLENIFESLTRLIIKKFDYIK